MQYEIKKLFVKILGREPSVSEIEHHISKFTTIEDKKYELMSCHERLHNQANVISQVGQSPLRIALMLVGHFRRFEPFSQVWSTFKSLHPNIDIFVHTWNERGLRSDKEWINTSEDIPDFETIYNTLKPVSMVREDHKKFLNSFSLKNKFPDKTLYLALGQKVSNHADFTKFIMSQLYGIYACFKNVKNYEDVNGFKYDIVIKLRADTVLYHPLVFKEKLKDNELFIHSRSHRHIDGGGGCLTCDKEHAIDDTKKIHESHTNDVCDVLVYGNSKVMERYCIDMYNDIPDILDKMDRDNLECLEKDPWLNKFVSKKENITYFGWCGDINKNLKLFYPERIIREYMKDYWLLSDPLYL